MQETINILSAVTAFFYVLSLLAEAWPSNRIRRTPLAVAGLCAGLLMHLAALLLRTRLVGHAPMANLYETLLFFSFCVALSTLIFRVRYGTGKPACITLPVGTALLVLAMLADHKLSPLYIALKTIWFEIHVMASFAGYALFTVSFSSAFFFLLSHRKDRTVAKHYEEITNSANIWGFSFFSFAMFSGAIWAYLAWGNYWFWEPKTIWSFILWFYFAGIVHGHYLKKWRGKVVAIMTLIGFFVVIFTYVGVGLMMKSSHNL